jgi:hypothetical protein
LVVQAGASKDVVIVVASRLSSPELQADRTFKISEEPEEKN